jgi:tocopherol cyclase
MVRNKRSDLSRDAFMLKGAFAKKGYDWWWHSFTGEDEITGEPRGFFFEFFVVNPALGADQPLFGALDPQSGDPRPSYLMVKAGAWGVGAKQLHRFYGLKQVKIASGVPFSVVAEGCSLSETASAGEVAVSLEEAKGHPEWLSDAGTMSWKLKIHKLIPYNVGYGANHLNRDLEAFQMYWHAEGMKTEYEGEVVYEGRRYRVRPETSYGYADKNWGSDFTSPWLWLASSHLTSLVTGKPLLNSAFDIGGGRPKIKALSLERKLLGYFFYEGKGYEFNFSKFWTFPKTSFSFCEEKDQVVWHVEQKTPHYAMVSDVTCPKKDMLFVRYESPEGLCLHQRLFNGGTGVGTIALYALRGAKKTLIDKVRAENVGCEYGEYATLGKK